MATPTSAKNPLSAKAPPAKLVATVNKLKFTHKELVAQLKQVELSLRQVLDVIKPGSSASLPKAKAVLSAVAATLAGKKKTLAKKALGPLTPDQVINELHKYAGQLYKKKAWNKLNIKHIQSLLKRGCASRKCTLDRSSKKPVVVKIKQQTNGRAENFYGDDLPEDDDMEHFYNDVAALEESFNSPDDQEQFYGDAETFEDGEETFEDGDENFSEGADSGGNPVIRRMIFAAFACGAAYVLYRTLSN